MSHSARSHFIALTFCFAAEAARDDIQAVATVAPNPNPRPVHEWCDTHRAWSIKRPIPNVAGAPCPMYGLCDDPSVRDMSIPDASTPIKTIRVHFVILRDGSDAAGTIIEAAEQIDQMNSDFAPYGFQFVHTTEFAESAEYRSLGDFDEFYDDTDIDAMKEAFAQSPQSQCNVYVTDLSGLPNAPFGSATFPWEDDALLSTGGVILDDDQFGADKKTLTHEMGHSLGLWHTHHGVTEFEGDSCYVDFDACDCPCYERADGTDADTTGDFCADTPPTPVNGVCSDPGGSDICSSTPWGETDFHNHMGYALPDSCRTQFTIQQAGRLHCWTQAELTSWLVPSGVSNVTASQRTDGSRIVDIHYDLAGGPATIGVQASDNDGLTWKTPITSANGDVGLGISPGVGKHIVWDSFADIPSVESLQFKIRLCASNEPAPSGMTVVPAGEYLMGDHHDEMSDALPVHAVYIGTFFMDIYEVSNVEYAIALSWALAHGDLIAVSDGRVYDSDSATLYCDTTSGPDFGSRITWNGSAFGVVAGKENHPMVMVSWYGAAAYANWQSQMAGRVPSYNTATWECDFDADGYRLPTEAEWEKAARGGNFNPYYRYPWGDSLEGSKANYWNSGDPFEMGTTPVGYYNGGQTPSGIDMANGYGLYDMTGNAWEFCNDRADGNYAESLYDNPRGPSSGSFSRVARGGSYYGSSIIDYSGTLRAAERSGAMNQDSRIGFRLVMASASCQASADFILDNFQNAFGDVDHDGLVNLDDILCILASFAGNYACASGLPNADIAPCGGDGLISLDDILAILQAFAGAELCP